MKPNAIHTFQVILEDCCYVENDSSQIIPSSFRAVGCAKSQSMRESIADCSGTRA